MARRSLNQHRQLFGLSLVVAILLGIYWWFFSAGLPVLWAPSASAADMAAGRELFEREWSAHDPLAGGDGLGPVFNAKSCAACHFQGGLGGGGGLAHNAVNYEVLPRPNDPQLHVGTIHNFSVNPRDKESFVALRKRYPIVPGTVVPSTPQPGMPDCPPAGPTRTPDFDPLRIESVQSTALFGVGWIDRISSKAIVHNARSRSVSSVMQEMSLDFSQIPVGTIRTLPDGRIGKFGWRGQFATLEEFVATACANELGLGTELVAQPKPLSHYQPKEVEPDLNRQQFRELMAFIDTLPRPVEVYSDNPTQEAIERHGKELFGKIGCTVCHVPDLGGVSGIYSDFLLYVLDNPHPPGGGSGPGGGYGTRPPLPVERELPDDLPRPEEWKTPPLWGVVDSAPYFHDGASPTLESAILRHQGDARAVTEAYRKLSSTDQQAIIRFLKTLKAPADAIPLRDTNITKLSKR